MEKTDARKLKTEVQHQLRKQAVRLRKRRMTYKKIAEIVGGSPGAVGGWCRQYTKHGAKGIKIKKRGRRH
jgi:transposase